MRSYYTNPRKNHHLVNHERREIANQLRAIEANQKRNTRRMYRAIKGGDEAKIARIAYVISAGQARIKHLLDKLAEIEKQTPVKENPVYRPSRTRVQRKAKVYHVWDRD